MQSFHFFITIFATFGKNYRKLPSTGTFNSFEIMKLTNFTFDNSLEIIKLTDKLYMWDNERNAHFKSDLEKTI